MASQGLLVLTAVLIQLTFYREIKLGPLLGMTKRPYWEIIYDRPLEIPEFILSLIHISEPTRPY